MTDKKLDAEHPDYAAMALNWAIVDDVIAGETAVKAKGEAYLPKTRGMIEHGDNAPRGFMEGAANAHSVWRGIGISRYDAYRLRAEFPEKTGPAADAAVGLFTDKDAAAEVPPEWEPVLDAFTLEGDTVWDFHRIVSEKVVRKGRAGVWADVRQDGLPYFVCYAAEEIIDWSEGTIGGARVLDKVKIKTADVLNGVEVFILTIAALTEAGVVVERFVKERKAGDEAWEKLDAAQPKTARADMGEALRDETGRVGGFRLKRIPFQFVNADGLTPKVGRIPFLPLAKQCLNIYRLDAGYKEALSFYEPQYFVTGMTQAWIDGGFVPNRTGVDTIWPLPEGATAGIIEYTGPAIANQRLAIQDALQHADELSMRPFEPSLVSVESGEAKKERTKTQTSAAKVMAQNIGSGVQKVMRFSAEWLGKNPEAVVFEPNYDFGAPVIDGQTLTQYVGAQAAGAFSKTTLHENLQRGGVTEKSFEEEQELIGRGE